MKTITIEIFPLKMSGKMSDVSTCDVLLQCLENQGKNGITLSEMRQRMTIISKVEAALADDATSITLEDAEVAKLADLVELMQWNIVSKDIVEIGDHLKGLKDGGPN